MLAQPPQVRPSFACPSGRGTAYAALLGPRWYCLLSVVILPTGRTESTLWYFLFTEPLGPAGLAHISRAPEPEGLESVDQPPVVVAVFFGVIFVFLRFFMSVLLVSAYYVLRRHFVCHSSSDELDVVGGRACLSLVLNRVPDTREADPCLCERLPTPGRKMPYEDHN